MLCLGEVRIDVGCCWFSLAVNEWNEVNKAEVCVCVWGGGVASGVDGGHNTKENEREYIQGKSFGKKIPNPKVQNL